MRFKKASKSLHNSCLKMYLNKKHRGVNEKALAMKCIVKLYIINKNTDNFKNWLHL